jgi:chemotaxis response regulator CheB
MPLAAPSRLPPVPQALAGESLEALGLLPTPRWDRGFWASGWQPGEAGAQDALEAFVEGAAHDYARQRDLPDRVGSSRLSPHLHFGELSPRQAIAAVRAVRNPRIPAEDVARFGVRLLSAIRLLPEVPLVHKRREGHANPPPLPPGRRIGGFGLFSSIGGPTALASLLWLLPRSLPYPVFIAQHITPGFTVGPTIALSRNGSGRRPGGSPRSPDR